MKKMNQLDIGKRVALIGVATAGLVCLSVPAMAGLKVYENKDTGAYAKIGGRVMMQYKYTDPDGGDSSDSLFFRRLRPYIEGSFSKNWKSKIQFDLGKAAGDNEIVIKDGYFQYKGFKPMAILIGNAKVKFSRSNLTSSKKRHLVERGFTGDHNYGTPDRQMGIHLTGHAGHDKMLTWGASVVSAALDPDANKLDFDTLANRSTDFNEGWMVGGRVDFAPMGQVKLTQGDFSGKARMSFGLGAFTWANDDDNNTKTTAGVADDIAKPDVDTVTGFEVSAAFRGMGFSVDAQYNLFNTETIDSTVTSGIYRNGSSDLKSLSLEAGYMLISKRLELAAGYEMQDADNYADQWTRKSVGATYFFNKYKAKVQLSYRIGENLKGATGADQNELFVQGQFVF